MSKDIVYTADSHVGHVNIIKYCWRPFPSVAKMDAALMIGLKDADRAGKRIFHAGDLTFNFLKVAMEWGVMLRSPHNHNFLFGNHDKDNEFTRIALLDNFGMLVGSAKDWQTNTLKIDDTLAGKRVQVLLSHEPQRDLQGCDFNVHGHIHNTLLVNQLTGQATESDVGYGWTLDSPQHFNACVELHDYAPATLEALSQAHEEKYQRAFATFVKPADEAPTENSLTNLHTVGQS